MPRIRVGILVNIYSLVKSALPGRSTGNLEVHTVTKVKSPYMDQVLQDILEAVEDAPQASDVEKTNTLSIQRVVRQCYALLSQEMERKVKLEPHLYSRERLDQVLGQFKATLPDIQDAIAIRVSESISELIRIEVRKVLQDALGDLQAAISDPAGPVEDGRETSRGVVEQTPIVGAERQADDGLTTGGEAPETLPIARTDPPAEAAAVGPSTDDPPPEVMPQTADVDSESHQVLDDTVYQGSVKVSVESHGMIKEMMRFLNEVSGHPDLHVRQVLGSYGTVTVWLALRKPLRLRQILLDMEMVTLVTARRSSAAKGSEYLLDVELGEDPTAPAS